MIRAFDSYTSTDGGNTWTAPSSGTPVLPPSSYATVPGGDVPLFKSGSTTTYATDVKDVVNSSINEHLLGTGRLLGLYQWLARHFRDPAAFPRFGRKWTIATPPVSFNGYTQGPGYYGKTFFIWPPDPRNTTTPSTLTGSTG